MLRLPRKIPAAADADWSRVTAGPWLEQTLKALRAADGEGADPGPALKGTLRPYQRTGTRWMHMLSSLGLGACLADDMGLGKTIQVLSLLLVTKQAGAAEPLGGACVAAGHLGGGDREIRTGAEGSDCASLGNVARRDQTVRARAITIWRSPATAPCCACRCWRKHHGVLSSWMRRRRSRTRPPARPGRPRH